MKRMILVVAVGLVYGAAGQAGAVVNAPAMVMGTPGVPTLDNSFGVLEEALNFGGADLVRDGISFTGVTSPNAPIINLDNSPFVIDMSRFPDGGGVLLNANIGPDPLFETEIYAAADPTDTQRLTISGLDPGRLYQFQLIHGDTRGYFFDRPVTFIDSGGNSAVTTLQFGINDGVDKSYAVVTVNVSGSTSLIYDMPTGGIVRGPSMSGLVIHSNSEGPSVPEPTTAALGVLAVGALVLLRRRVA